MPAESEKAKEQLDELFELHQELGGLDPMEIEFLVNHDPMELASKLPPEEARAYEVQDFEQDVPAMERGIYEYSKKAAAALRHQGEEIRLTPLSGGTLNLTLFRHSGAIGIYLRHPRPTQPGLPPNARLEAATYDPIRDRWEPQMSMRSTLRFRQLALTSRMLQYADLAQIVEQGTRDQEWCRAAGRAGYRCSPGSVSKGGERIRVMRMPSMVDVFRDRNPNSPRPPGARDTFEGRNFR